jgi:hypothetical protein
MTSNSQAKRTALGVLRSHDCRTTRLRLIVLMFISLRGSISAIDLRPKDNRQVAFQPIENYSWTIRKAGALRYAYLLTDKPLSKKTDQKLNATLVEEIGVNGRHLGNHPQAFTHLPLISAATYLDRRSFGHKGGIAVESRSKKRFFSSFPL